jgi:hypothetical protein
MVKLVGLWLTFFEKKIPTEIDDFWLRDVFFSVFFRKKTFPTKICFCIYMLGQYARRPKGPKRSFRPTATQLPMDPIIETDDILPTQTQAKNRGRPPKKLTNGDAISSLPVLSI